MGARVVVGEDASLVISGRGSTPSGGHGAATNGHDTKVMNPMITPNLEHLNNSNAPNLKTYSFHSLLVPNQALLPKNWIFLDSSSSADLIASSKEIPTRYHKSKETIRHLL